MKKFNYSNMENILDYEYFKEYYPKAPAHALTRFIWKYLLDKDYLCVEGQEDDAIYKYLPDWYDFLRNEVVCEECYLRDIRQTLTANDIYIINVTIEERNHIYELMVLDLKNALQHKLDCLKGVESYEKM